MNLGFTEMLLIAGIALLLFGPSRLPGLGKSMGEAIRGFKKGLNEDETITEARPVNEHLAYQNRSQEHINVNKAPSQQADSFQMNADAKNTEKNPHS